MLVRQYGFPQAAARAAEAVVLMVGEEDEVDNRRVVEGAVGTPGVRNQGIVDGVAEGVVGMEEVEADDKLVYSGNMVAEDRVVAQGRVAVVDDGEVVAEMGMGCEGDEGQGNVDCCLEMRCRIRYGDCTPGPENHLDEFLGWTFDTT